MSISSSVSGRKLKNISDPSLAHSHQAGAVVNFAQPAIDPIWGRFHFFHYPRNYTYFSKGLKFYKQSIKLLNECRSEKLDAGDIRTIPENLKEKLEYSSAMFLVLTKLGVEYLIADYLLAISQIKNHKNEKFSYPRESAEITVRLKALMIGLGISEPVPQVIHTILARRDIVEHPTTERIYNGSEKGWKNNHLAWVLSGEMDNMEKELISFINRIVKTAIAYKDENPVPGNLIIGVRGLRAGEQAKKNHTD